MSEDATEDTRHYGSARILSPVAVGRVYLDTDLAELRKLAEINPELAQKVIDQRLKETDNERWRYALGTTIVAGLAALLFATWRGAKRGDGR